MSEPTLNDLHAEMVKTFDALKEANDKGLKEAEERGGAALAETREKLEKIDADMTALRTQYEERMKEIQRVKPADGGLSAEDMEQRGAYEKFLRYGMGENSTVSWTPEEKRSLSGRSDSEGGFLIPPAFENQLIINAYNMAEIRPLCNVGMTGRDSVKIPKLGKPSVAWGVKDLAVTAQTLTDGQVTIPIIDLKALVTIPNDTLDDAASDVWAELMGAFDSAVAEAEDTAFALGAGGDLAPQGIFTSTAVQANNTITGVAAALTDSTHNGVDAMLSALYGLNKTYRRNATWCWNSTTEALVRKFKDTTGQYLWQPPVQAGAPSTYLGRPVANAESAPDVGAGAYPIAVGDFRSGYKIRDRAGISVKRLVERYAEYDMTGFMLKKRVGGTVAQAEAFACIKVSAS